MFGQRLAEERRRLGLSQKELADKLGVGRSTVGMIETDRVEIDAKRLVRLGPDGFDVVFILTGEPARLAAGRILDWGLCYEITRRLFEWAASREIQVPADKAAAIVKTIYLQLAQHGALDERIFEDTMRAAA